MDEILVCFGVTLCYEEACFWLIETTAKSTPQASKLSTLAEIYIHPTSQHFYTDLPQEVRCAESFDFPKWLLYVKRTPSQQAQHTQITDFYINDAIYSPSKEHHHHASASVPQIRILPLPAIPIGKERFKRTQYVHLRSGRHSLVD